jgi:hypothetical protein
MALESAVIAYAIRDKLSNCGTIHQEAFPEPGTVS